MSFNAYLGRYLMLYSRFLEKDVVIRTANQPWGPWSPETAIHRYVLSKPEAFCYAGKEHPEYARENGRKIYFSLVDNSRSMGGVPDLFEAVLKSNP